ncbi:MAG TPA: heme ABC exporter ATP-binding protein CcmA [Candidatus Limnocylindrales bacterium]|nr:heme ABC exporter ATP-binding protein CcmA [Candidatus Limnocylindrales bacterium]
MTSAATSHAAAGTTAASEESGPAIRIQSLRRRFAAVPVLRGVDLVVTRGECVAIFGANGAGKTTLLRMLAGLLRAESGTVELFGAALPASANLRRRIGYLGHESFLYRDLDARENLAYYGRLFAVHDPSRADAMIARVGLAHASTKLVGTYSRGMLQRLGLARALLHAPDLLLLDEPLTGLDPAGARLLSEILDERRAQGVTIVMATHDIDRALESATRAVILDRGQVAWDSAADGNGVGVPDAAQISARCAEIAAPAGSSR